MSDYNFQQQGDRRASYYAQHAQQQQGAAPGPAPGGYQGRPVSQAFGYGHPPANGAPGVPPNGDPRFGGSSSNASSPAPPSHQQQQQQPHMLDGGMRSFSSGAPGSSPVANRQNGPSPQPHAAGGGGPAPPRAESPYAASNSQLSHSQPSPQPPQQQQQYRQSQQLGHGPPPPNQPSPQQQRASMPPSSSPSQHSQQSQQQSKPQSLITQGPNGPMIAGETLHDLDRAIQLLRTNKFYAEGFLMKKVEVDPDGRATTTADAHWAKFFVQLTGPILSVWNATDMEQAAKAGKTVPPSYLNLSDCFLHPYPPSPQGAPTPTPHQFALNSAGLNRILFCAPSAPSLSMWINAIRLAVWERSRCLEIYTGSLLGMREPRQGWTGFDGGVMGTRNYFEGSLKARLPGETEWRQCWVVVLRGTASGVAGAQSDVSPKQKRRSSLLASFGKKTHESVVATEDLPGSGTISSVVFYSSRPMRRDLKPICVCQHVYFASALFPESEDAQIINRSALFKLEGTFLNPADGYKGGWGVGGRAERQGFALLMPDEADANTMLQWIIGVADAFKLYGRPRGLSYDPRDPQSLYFALPLGPHLDRQFLDRELVDHLDVSESRPRAVRASLHNLLFDRMRGIRAGPPPQMSQQPPSRPESAQQKQAPMPPPQIASSRGSQASHASTPTAGSFSQPPETQGGLSAPANALQVPSNRGPSPLSSVHSWETPRSAPGSVPPVQPALASPEPPAPPAEDEKPSRPDSLVNGRPPSPPLARGPEASSYFTPPTEQPPSIVPPVDAEEASPDQEQSSEAGGAGPRSTAPSDSNEFSDYSKYLSFANEGAAAAPMGQGARQQAPQLAKLDTGADRFMGPERPAKSSARALSASPPPSDTQTHLTYAQGGRDGVVQPPSSTFAGAQPNADRLASPGAPSPQQQRSALPWAASSEDHSTSQQKSPSPQPPSPIEARRSALERVGGMDGQMSASPDGMGPSEQGVRAPPGAVPASATAQRHDPNIHADLLAALNFVDRAESPQPRMPTMTPSMASTTEDSPVAQRQPYFVGPPQHTFGSYADPSRRSISGAGSAPLPVVQDRAVPSHETETLASVPEPTLQPREDVQAGDKERFSDGNVMAIGAAGLATAAAAAGTAAAVGKRDTPRASPEPQPEKALPQQPQPEPQTSPVAAPTAPAPVEPAASSPAVASPPQPTAIEQAQVNSSSPVPAANGGADRSVSPVTDRTTPTAALGAKSPVELPSAPAVPPAAPVPSMDHERAASPQLHQPQPVSAAPPAALATSSDGHGRASSDMSASQSSLAESQIRQRFEEQQRMSMQGSYGYGSPFMPMMMPPWMMGGYGQGGYGQMDPMAAQHAMMAAQQAAQQAYMNAMSSFQRSQSPQGGGAPSTSSSMSGMPPSSSGHNNNNANNTSSMYSGLPAGSASASMGAMYPGMSSASPPPAMMSPWGGMPPWMGSYYGGMPPAASPGGGGGSPLMVQPGMFGAPSMQGYGGQAPTSTMHKSGDSQDSAFNVQSFNAQSADGQLSDTPTKQQP